MRHLTIIGTGHVFRIGQTVAQAIVALAPDVVYVELDAGRLRALQARRQGLKPTGKAGFVQRKLQNFQEGVAKQYGGEVGEEMLAAVDAARQIGARIALVDDPAEQTLRRVVKELTWREKFRGVGHLIKGMFASLRPKPSIEDEIQRYQNDPTAAMAEVGKHFPTIYRVLIAERDERMAKRVMQTLGENERGVLVIGDGHVDGMAPLLDMEKEIFRLAAVRAGNLPRPGGVARGDGVDVNVSYNLRW